MDEPENNLKTSNLKTLWQDQPVEPAPMSLEAVQQRALHLQNRLLWDKVGVYIGATIFVSIASYIVLTCPDRYMAAAYLLDTFAVLFILYYHHRHGKVDCKAVREPTQACVDFHRQALINRRKHLSTAWAWMILPLVPGTALMFHQANAWVNAAQPWRTSEQVAATHHLMAAMNILGVILFVAAPFFYYWRAHARDAELKSLGEKN